MIEEKKHVTAESAAKQYDRVADHSDPVHMTQEELDYEKKIAQARDRADLAEVRSKIATDGGLAEDRSACGVEEEKKRAHIRVLERLHIGNAQKAELMLVSLGLKPATELLLYESNDKKEAVISILEEAGLEFSEKDLCPGDKPVAKLAVSNNKEMIVKLMASEANRDHEEYGRLMGYPESAVEAFVKKELLENENYPDMSDVIFPIKLSKGNWQNEVEVLKGWSDAIKKYSPNLYNELLRKSKPSQAS